MTLKLNFFYILLIFIFFMPGELCAIEYTYSVDSSYETSNNLTQQIDGESGQAIDLGLAFSLNNSLQKEWDLDFSGRIGRTNYSETDLSNQLNTEIQGIAIYKSLTSNFSFTSLLDISQAPVNRFQTQEVNNTRDQTVTVLMPSYYYAINSADRINASYTILDASLEEVEGIQAGQASSSLDQNILLNYLKRVNATNTVALNWRISEVDFDADLSQGGIDYDRKDLFISWAVTGQTDQLQLELGRSNITDVLNREQQQKYQLFNYTRQLNRTNSLYLAYTNGFNNPLSNIQATNSITVNQNNNNITAAQSIKQYSFGYAYTGDSVTIGLNILDGEVSQSFTQTSESRKGYSANIRYQLSRILNNSGRSNIAINYSKTQSDFDSIQTNIQENQVENYVISYNYIYSLNLAFSLSYSVRETFQLDTSNIESLFDSTSTFFTVTYTDRGRF